MFGSVFTAAVFFISDPMVRCTAVGANHNVFAIFKFFMTDRAGITSIIHYAIPFPYREFVHYPEYYNKFTAKLQY